MPSDMLFTYEKRRTKDSNKDKSQGSEEIMPANSAFDNPKKISFSPHYKRPWQRKLSRKYPQIKQKEDPDLPSGNQFFSDTVQRLQLPGNGHGTLDVRTDQRIKKASSPDSYSLKAQRTSQNQHRSTYKVERNSPNSWKPIRGHKITDSFTSRYETTNSNPFNYREDILAYKDKPQDFKEEEDSYGNRQEFGDDSGDEDYDDIDNDYANNIENSEKKTLKSDDSGDGDEDYDDIDNDYASKIKKALKSDGNSIGLQEIYQQKDDSVQKYLNHVPYPANIKDGTISYEHGHSSRYSENGTEENERTQNIIQSRIDHLKERIKREMARNIYSEQNARAPLHGNIANSVIKWVQD
jgi:hypothetical protein